MKKYKFDIIIPIYNEGYNLIKLLKLIKIKLKKDKFNIILCYDNKKDNVFNYLKEIKKIKIPIYFSKNSSSGPCTAVINIKEQKVLQNSLSSRWLHEYSADFKCIIKNLNKSDIVVASRFIKGGSMKGCPLLKSIIVRFASWSLYTFSSIPVKDASNGFRLFSSNLLQKVKLESRLGFAYSLELLVKCERLGLKIDELPAKWEERTEEKVILKFLNG